MSSRLYTIIKTATAVVLMAAATPVATATRDDASRFAEAREAFKAEERVHLAHAAESLRSSEFAPWVEYWQLRLRIEEDSDEGVGAFLEREAGSYQAEKLRAAWLRRLGMREDWKTFQQEYPTLLEADRELSCYALRARLERRQDATALDDARQLWFAVIDLPDVCDPLMDRLLADKRLRTDDVWTRLRLLVEQRRFSAARAVAGKLPTEQAIDSRKLDAATDNPARYLDRLPANFAATRGGRELALYAVVRLSRKDPIEASRRWRALEAYYAADDRAYTWGQIAWRAALDHLPEALGWYALADDANLSEEQHAWHARAALRAQDWAALDRAVGRMPQKLAAQPEWIYWLGRAHAAQGRKEEARTLFLGIAERHDFYGHLANEELGWPVALPEPAEPPTAAELAEVEANPGLRRALAVLRTDPEPDMRLEAVREWAWYLRGMDDRHLLAAAEFAGRQGAIDRGISAAERTQGQHDFRLRYPIPFRDEIGAKVSEATLDSAWVYGLMRQESRFVADARSAAGARGLMQLMPTTARWVARKIGLADYHPSRMHDLDTNISLGTSYLKMVLDSLDDQPVLASAGYNAGPRRARQWRSEQALEGAIYVETIPFNETRDYVKKVMSNAVYYSILLNSEPRSLKARLGTIGPADDSDTAALKLP
ncbi:MAG: lytic transglycosylase domain-containing protein [Gammaproteobacteria bacterium]|nr:lytic transglycosylase domain-containing protein [Gammaproteobacteria bacterium]MBU1415938.1 lytic transglycosylase domain-containing protein [Gammaproteobacteria bacterium]